MVSDLDVQDDPEGAVAKGLVVLSRAASKVPKARAMT